MPGPSSTLQCQSRTAWLPLEFVLPSVPSLPKCRAKHVMAAAVSLDSPAPPGNCHSGGACTALIATPGAPLASPKRVSFAASPPGTKPSSGGASQAAAALWQLRVQLADAGFQGSPLAAAAADHGLTFLPEVDSPRRQRLSMLTQRPSGCRLPCNEASWVDRSSQHVL